MPSGDDDGAAGRGGHDGWVEDLGAGGASLGGAAAYHPDGEVDLPGPAPDPHDPGLDLQDVAGVDRREELHVGVRREQSLVTVGEDAQLRRDVPEGGQRVGTVDEVGTDSPLGLTVGDRVATLVSLSLTPLAITDGLARWDGLSEQVPAAGHAILFERSIAAVIPDDLDPRLSLMVMDVCGAPALVSRVVHEYAVRHVEVEDAPPPSVLVLGGAGKSGSLSLAAAREAGAGRLVAVVPNEREAALLRPTGLADHVVIADARSPMGLAAAVETVGGPCNVTVVCVDVPGCEQPSILATAQGGSIIFFSMATSFAAAALGAEGLAADVRMIVGNGYTPGHAAYAMNLLRRHAAVRELFEGRLEG